MLRIVGLQLHPILRPPRPALPLAVYAVAGNVVPVAVVAGVPVPVDVVPGAAGVAHHDPGRAIEAVLQMVPDDAERWESHPAGFYRAGPRHSVALAFLPHLGLHVLKQGQKDMMGGPLHGNLKG